MKIKYKTPRNKRKIRVKKKITGTLETPRVAVFRSNKNIYAQAIDDIEGTTIVSANSLGDEFKDTLANISVAKQVGLLLGEALIKKGIKKVVFDRSGYVYHGQVKSLAEGIREQGAKF